METYQEYKVLRENEARKLSSSVNSYLKQGWVPVGGVSITNAMIDEYANSSPTGKDGVIYSQAMGLPKGK